MNENMNSENNNQQIKKKESRKLLIIFGLLMVVVAISGFAYSKMQTRDGGGDSARVARYIVSASAVSSGTEMKINCNDADQDLVATYVFTVSNNENGSVSELDTGYNVIVTLDTELPEGVTAVVDDVAGTVSSNGKKITFSSSSWVMQARVATTNTHTLTFTADPTIVTENFNIKVAVKIHTEQIN